MLQDLNTVYKIITMTEYAVPQAKTFNLLGEDDQTNDKTQKQKVVAQPVSHMKSKITFTIMTDDIKISKNDVPLELLYDLK